jgi:Uma2 family endonuclease
MMSPAGGRHGRISFRLAQLLGTHVESNSLGVVFAAETGFLVDRFFGGWLVGMR